MATIWLTIAVAGVLTFMTRLSFIALLGRWQPPELLHRALRYVPPAVLSAIIFPELLMHEGQVYLSIYNLRLLAGLVAVIVGWRTRNIFLTIAAGMLVLYGLQAFLTI